MHCKCFNITNDNHVFIIIFFSYKGSFIHKIAKTVGITSKDSKEAEHKEQFTALVREVKGVLNANNCPYLSVSILPHVNSSGNFFILFSFTI